MIEEIVKKLEIANKSYRIGEPIMSDVDYDQLVETLCSYDPCNKFFDKVGFKIIDENRKTKLDIIMASMNKAKTMFDISDWCRLRRISKNEIVVITPKFDGLSLCVNEYNNKATTRGDGEYGQRSDEHYKLIQNHLSLPDTPFLYTYGEVIMSKQVFNDKYSKWNGNGDFSNPRNLVAGLINSSDVKESLKDCIYIKYGAIPNDKHSFINKSDILKILNDGQEIKVDYHECKINELTEELLISLFKNWSIDYEIDGLIIEVNDINLQYSLGRETSTNNPLFSIAFKHDSFEQKVQTTILEIEDNISKQGLIKPVAIVEPILIDGVMVSRCTLNNYKFVKDNGLGAGAKVVIKRSGMVIPKIVEVLESVEFVMPTIEGVEIGWNDAGIELITLTETDEQKIKKNIAFFEILEADNLGAGVVTQLWNAGYKTIKDILNISLNDFESIDGFGKRKAKIVFDSIKKSVTDVELCKLQHASGLFVGLGSKKLKLLEEFKTKPTVEQIMSIEGFAEISAKIYIDNYDKFFEFISDLPVTIAKKVEAVKVSNDLDGTSFVFTGVRDKDAEEVIVSRGGKIGGSVSKTTTHLICKDVNSGSSKLEKAKSLGVTIMCLSDLTDFLS